MELNKKIRIKIYNVESPGKFWFRTMSDAKEIKVRLGSYLERYGQGEEYTPKIGEIVIIEVFNRDRIVRVKKILDENLIVISFLENGHQFHVSNENLIPLKDRELADLAINSVWTGSINGALPAKAELNLETNSAETKIIKDWSPKSIEMFKINIKKSIAVYIKAKHINSKTRMVKGMLTVESDILQALVNRDHAICYDLDSDYDADTDEFEPEFLLDEDVADSSSDTHPVISVRNESILKAQNGNSPEAKKSSNSSTINGMNSSQSETSSDSLENSNGTVSSNDLSKETLQSDVTIPVIGQLTEEIEENDQNLSNNRIMNALSPITECSLEDDESTMTSCVSHVHSYLLENSETEDEPEQFEYKWTKEIELKRSLDAANSLKKKIINHLLQRATLYKIEPFVYSTVKFEPDERLQYCESFIEALNDHNKLYPVQEIIWPYIKSGRPSILIGKTDFYPHLLYLPPILNLVKMLEDPTKPRIDGPKVVIFASNFQEATEIRQICSSFIDEKSVYTDAEDYAMDFNERKYDRCEIYVSLIGRISDDPDAHIPKTAKMIVLNNFDAIECEKRKTIVNSVLNYGHNVLVTSRHYVEELRTLFDQIPNMLVSVESDFDLWYFTSEEMGSRSTEVRIFEPECKQMLQKLRTKLSDLQRHKVVIVCISANKARRLSNDLWSKCGIKTIVNRRPQRGDPKVFICSDDQLAEFDVHNANHIIHYDLPVDFDTFCHRYSVLRSCLTFKHENTVKPLSLIFVKLRDEPDRKMQLILRLFREYNITIMPPRFENILREIEINLPSRIDIGIDR